MPFAFMTSPTIPTFGKVKPLLAHSLLFAGIPLTKVLELEIIFIAAVNRPNLLIIGGFVVTNIQKHALIDYSEVIFYRAIQQFSVYLC